MTAMANGPFVRPTGGAAGERTEGDPLARPVAGRLEPAAVLAQRGADVELRISARLLLHLARQPRFEVGEVVPTSLTQEGISAALGTSQPAVSNVLRRLVVGGAVEVRRHHVRGKFQRLKVYQLTPTGDGLVRQIRASMARAAPPR